MAAGLLAKGKALALRGLGSDFRLKDMGGSRLPKFMGAVCMISSLA